MSYPRQRQEKRSVSEEAGSVVEWLSLTRQPRKTAAVEPSLVEMHIVETTWHAFCTIYNTHLVCLSGLACACLKAAGPAQPSRRLACLKYSFHPSHSGDVVVFAESYRQIESTVDSTVKAGRTSRSEIRRA